MKEGLDKFWEIEQNTAALNVIDFKSGKPRIAKINET